MQRKRVIKSVVKVFQSNGGAGDRSFLNRVSGVQLLRDGLKRFRSGIRAAGVSVIKSAALFRGVTRKPILQSNLGNNVVCSSGVFLVARDAAGDAFGDSNVELRSHVLAG